MIAYKGTENLKCRNKKYKVGKTYTQNKEPIMCCSGFHFCEKLYQINVHYPFREKENVYLEIEALGKIIKDEDKCVTNKFKVLRIIPETEFHEIDPEHFDKHGNLIYFENSNGYWSKRQYDENNNLIYYENSNKFWEKYKYDENNNKIYFENSSEYWDKRQYDKKNNEIYYEDSNGYWCKKEYDENNKYIKTTSGNKKQ